MPVLSPVQRAADRLSSLIVNDDGDDTIVVIPQELLQEQQDPPFWQEVASATTSKFRAGGRNQPQYDWHVSYISEQGIFVAIPRRYIDDKRREVRRSRIDSTLDQAPPTR